MDYHSIPFYFNSTPGIFLLVSPAATIVLGILFTVLVLISFLMAGSEIAFFSLQYKDLNLLKTRTQPSYKRIVNLLETPKNLQSTILISNSFSNIGIILIGNMLLNNVLPADAIVPAAFLVMKIAILVVFLVLFVEILPKVWATHHKITFASNASLVIEIFHSLFSGLGSRLTRMNQSVETGFGTQNNSAENSNLDDAIDLLPDTEASTAEKQILKGIRKFGDIEVRQIMRPRMDVSGIPSTANFHDVLSQVSTLNYSRIPIYKANLDELSGMLHTKDLIPYLDEPADFDWHTIMREPLYVHEQKLIEDLMQEFLQKRIHFAIVVDEFGGTSGIVTLEDIMEEIIGEIKDEFDDEESVNKKLDDYNYIFEGKMMIGDACVAMGIPQDTFDTLRGESDSIGGLVLEIAGEFPEENTNFVAGDFTIIPLSISKNRVERVQITIKPQPAEQE